MKPACLAAFNFKIITFIIGHILIGHILAGRRSPCHARRVRRRGLFRAQEMQVLLPGGSAAAGLAGRQVPPRRRLEEQRRAAQMRRRSGGDDIAIYNGEADADDDECHEGMDNDCTPADNDNAE